LGISDNFINRGLDLHESGFGLFIKRGSFTDCTNASFGGDEDCDWVNL